MENYITYKNKQGTSYTARPETHQGEPYLVVPAVMMVEGVHNGSHGPMLHSIAELGKFPASWNGIPIVIDHPEVNGVNVSANDPEIIEQQTVGRVYNTKVKGSKLMAELWLHEAKLRQLSTTVLAAIQAGETLEISLGMFTEAEEVPGNWKGETYNAVAKSHRPDHLALLPGGVGACSCADGCGIRANNKKGESNVKNEDWLKELNDLKEGHYANLINANIDQGYKALVDAARQKLDGMDSENSVHYLEEVYPEFVIYTVRLRVGGTKLYKQGYAFDGGAIELQGNPTEVKRKVEYVTMAEGSGLVRTRFNNNKKEDNNMANETCTPCIKKKVDELIANSQGHWTEEDRVMLETLSEVQLDKMKPVEVVKEVTKEVQVNAMSEEDKVALATYRNQLKQAREKVIGDIQANTSKEQWPNEVLEGMNDDTLKRLFDSVKKAETGNYALNGVSTHQETSDEVLLPTGVKEIVK